MDSYKLFEHVKREIDKMRADQINALASGRVADHSEYRFICGVIRGLSLSESFINDLVQRMEKFDDE